MAEFNWESAMPVLGGAVSGVFQYMAARDTAKAQNEIRAANNRIANSNSVLARTLQDLNNKRLLDAAGKNVDTATRAAGRLQDATTSQGFEASIAQAEALGQVTVQMGAAGMTGSSVAAISQVAALTAARREQYREEGAKDATYEQLQAITGILPSAVRGLDNSVQTARQDYTQDTSSPLASYLVGGLLANRQSLQNLLGSLVPQQDTGNGVQVGQVYTPRATGTDLGPANFAFSTPVSDNNVRGTPLAPITLN